MNSQMRPWRCAACKGENLRFHMSNLVFLAISIHPATSKSSQPCSTTYRSGNSTCLRQLKAISKNRGIAWKDNHLTYSNIFTRKRIRSRPFLYKTHAYTQNYAHICMQLCLHMFVFLFIYLYIYIYIYIYICIYVCIHIHAHVQFEHINLTKPFSKHLWCSALFSKLHQPCSMLRPSRCMFSRSVWILASLPPVTAEFSIGSWNILSPRYPVGSWFDGDFAL